LGFGLIVIGVILLLISVLTSGPESCPANGCVPGEFLWYNVVRDAAFFSSISFIALGIILLIVARRMKPAQETETPIAQGPPAGKIGNYVSGVSSDQLYQVYRDGRFRDN
jgi:hypothetical protein